MVDNRERMKELDESMNLEEQEKEGEEELNPLCERERYEPRQPGKNCPLWMNLRDKSPPTVESKSPGGTNPSLAKASQVEMALMSGLFRTGSLIHERTNDVI